MRNHARKFLVNLTVTFLGTKFSNIISNENFTGTFSSVEIDFVLILIFFVVVLRKVCKINKTKL